MSDSAASVPLEMKHKFDDPEWGADKLETIEIFKNFTFDELKSLWKIGKVSLLNPGAHAIIEGEPSRGLYIILFGKVSVYKNDTVSGAMHRIAYLEEGAAFGELSLFDDAPRSATVVADTSCYVFHLDAHDFDRHLGDIGGDELKVRFYQKCAEDLAERFRSINSDYIVSQQLLWKYALRKDEEASDSEAKK